MGARENKCQISQNDSLHMKFSEVYLRYQNSCEICLYFFGLPLEIFFGVTTDN